MDAIRTEKARKAEAAFLLRKGGCSVNRHSDGTAGRPFLARLPPCWFLLTSSPFPPPSQYPPPPTLVSCLPRCLQPPPPPTAFLLTLPFSPLPLCFFPHEPLHRSPVPQSPACFPPGLWIASSLTSTPEAAGRPLVPS